MPGAAHASDFGRYELRRLLGRGGMGEVYLARDRTLERDVALKFVAASRLSEAGSRQRLLREAQAAASLDHPSICTVYEAGEAPDGRAYIAMQYVEGESLADRLQQGPLPVREALTLSAHIADALASAHKHGVIHRDLKPGNVIVTPTGRPKLLDFGLAKVARTVIPPDASTITGVTQIGTIVGTPPYMAPELIRQQAVDGRSDLFSLGVLLVECLTGRRVFEGPTPYETIANVLHVDPPPVSTLRAGLTEQHDELCARLLAKNPAERFQSAEEAHGALRVLVPDPSRTHTVPHPLPRPPRVDWRLTVSAAVVAAALAVGLGWYWRRPPPLPAAPTDARVWYDRGTEAIREGAYQTGRRALEEATNRFPQYALAYARLAEADAELDDEGSALKRLARVSTIVRDESQLPSDEQLRVRAVRASVLRDVDAAVQTYAALAARHPTDAGAWVDLGRAQESAGLRSDASASYRRAIQQDPQYPIAHLRLGSVEGAALHMDEALASFAEAERLYDLASSTEGRTEVLLRRGTARDAAGDLKAARSDLESALARATDSKAVVQQVRARLGLASVTASEGRLGEAEQMASGAVQEAIAAGLDTLAADGLIDLAATLTERGRLREGMMHARRALQLATNRGARRTAARARLQLAELLRLQDQSREALSIVNDVLPFLRANRYRRFELFGLLIAARAHEQLGEIEQSQQMTSGVLQVAESLKDEGRIALAASDLAASKTALGRYPDALALRERAEGIYRRQGDQGALPYTLANHADLLIRLGRLNEAKPVLAELDAGIAKGLEAYVGRARRATFLRAFGAATALRCDEALTLLAKVSMEPEAADSTSLLAPGVTAFCEARLGRRSAPPSPPKQGADPVTLAERDYWLAAAALSRDEGPAAGAAAAGGLKRLAKMANDELQWRLAAVSEAAGRPAGAPPGRSTHRDVAREAYERTRASFGPAFRAYESRPDVVDLRRRAGLS